MRRGMAIATLVTMCCVLSSCNWDGTQGVLHRHAIQGFSATFYNVTDGKERWREIAIAVDGSKVFRMATFFTRQGEIVDLTDEDAKRLLDKWLKDRAKQVASFGIVDPHGDHSEPYLSIEQIVR